MKTILLKDTVQRTIAKILILVMCIGMMPAMAFAEEKEPEKVNLVVFGNSMSSGYGLPDFLDRNDGFATLNNYLEQWAAEEDGFTPEKWAEENFGDTSDWTDQSFWTLKAAEDFAKKHKSISRMSNFAYPWLLKKYMSQEEGKKVNLVPFTLNGMRTDELRAFLDKDYYDKVHARELAYGERYIEENHIPAEKAGDYRNGFMSAHMKWYARDFSYSKATDDNSYDAASAYVKQSIKDADVIVVDLCGNNFGTYIGYRLSSFLGLDKSYASNTYETIADVDELPEPLMKSILAIKDELKSRVDMFNSGVGSQLLESYLYAVADCIVNFSANMEMIHEINPDAKVIAAGLNNSLAGLKIKAGDTTVDFGEIAGNLFELLNTYMRVLDKNSGNYYYAHTPLELSSFSSLIANAESLEALLSDGKYEDGRGAYAIDVIYQSFVNEFLGGEEGDCKTVYNMIQSAVKNAMKSDELVFKSWDKLADDEQIMVQPPVGDAIGLRYDPTATSIDKAIVMEGGVPLTKEIIREITKQAVKPSIENMLYEALHDHGVLDISKLEETLANMDKTAEAIGDYLAAVIAGDKSATMDEAYWMLLVIEERFLLSNGIGEHPSAVGCTGKYEAVLDAYLSDTTASEEVKEEVTAKLKELYAKIQEIAEKIKDTEEYQKIMEELQPIIDQLKVYGYALYALPEYEEAIEAYGKAVELFANEIADLQDTVDGLEQGNTELISQLDDLQKETDGLVAQLDAVKKQNEELEKKATSYKGEIEKLNAMIKDLEEDLAALQFAQEKVKLKKVTAGKKSLTATWNKLSGADGYQVSYKVGKKTSKKNVKGGSKTKLKVKKLKSGKKYTVKVRAYKTVKGKKVYSKWSSGKKAKVK